jgi:hypothetical protein
LRVWQRGRLPACWDVETLVAHLLEKALSHSADSNLLDEITQAYARGTEPPTVSSWDQVETELATTISPFASPEAAMVYARGMKCEVR